MKSFLKYTLATITGLFIASILFSIIMFVSMSAMLASADKAVTLSKNSVLVLNTGVKIPEKGNNDPFSTFDPISFTMKPMPGVNDIIRNLNKAARDENIKGLVIENGPMVHGWAKAREIREAILKFKESGKFVISYTNMYLTQENYYISTAADKIYLNPVALMEFKGIGSEIMFYKKALEKVGVEVQVVRHGKFKGAVEPYLGNSLSKENREQIERYTSGIWSSVLEEIAAARDISEERLNEIANTLLVSDISKAVEANLIDGLLYKDEYSLRLKNLSDTTGDIKPELVSMSKYNTVRVAGAPTSSNKIAVVYAEGSIVIGSGNASNIGGTHYASVIRKIRESDKYSALVLRVNSRGGAVIASDYIWREIELISEKMPVVISMGNYAASGGYYISAPADAIFAHPTTITGSIGVYGMIPQAGKLLNEKLGINSEKIMTNPYADNPSLYRPMSNYELEIMQNSVDRNYADFIQKVSDGRDIEVKDVDLMGEGHVFIGTDALEKKLIDKLGGLPDAIEHAAELAEIPDYRVVELPEAEDAYTKLLKSLGGEIRAKIISKELGIAADYYNDINELMTLEGVQARMPYILKLR